jgi:transcriptional regulator with XRE-family HTH domain
MDDQRIGAAIRAVRVMRRLRQADVATRGRVTRITVSRPDRGQVGWYSIDVWRRLTNALEIRQDVAVRWHGGDLDRVLNAAHASLHEAVSRWLAEHREWTCARELTFAIHGERGVIDIPAWHAAARSLLIIELRSVLADRKSSSR